MPSGAAQYAAVHAVYLAVRLEEGGVIAAGDKGLLFLHAGQQILLAALVQLAEHIVQQQHGVFAGDAGGSGGLGHLQAQHHAALLSLAGKHTGRLIVQQQFQIFPVDAAQALPGPQLLVLALLQQIGQTARRKLGGIAFFCCSTRT